MSSILKALRKLEEEKHTPHPYEFRIDSDILRNDIPKRKRTVTYFMIGLLLFAGGAAATYVLMKHEYKVVTGKKTEQTQQSKSGASKNSTTTASSTKIPEFKTEVLPVQIKIVPTNVIAKPEQIMKINKDRNPDKLPVSQKMPGVEGDKRDKPVSAPPTLNQTKAFETAPLLRVNGIAYQDGANDNMAIINGVPVSDGATVEGVKIERIYKDRIRFNQAGEIFEIQLGKSNR